MYFLAIREGKLTLSLVFPIMLTLVALGQVFEEELDTEWSKSKVYILREQFVRGMNHQIGGKVCVTLGFFIFISTKSILGVGTTELYFFGRFFGKR